MESKRATVWIQKRENASLHLILCNLFPLWIFLWFAHQASLRSTTLAHQLRILTHNPFHSPMMVIRSSAVFLLGSGCGERNQNDNARRDFRHLTIAHSSRLILSISFFWHFSLLPNLQQIWVSPLSCSETTLFILLFWQSLCQNDICYACLFYRLCTTWGRDLVPFIHIPSTWYRVDVQLTACWLIVLPTP